MYVPNCYPEYSNNLSMLQHKAIRARLESESRHAVKEFMRSKLELSELWLSMGGGVKLKRDQKAVLQFAGLSSSKSLVGQNEGVVSASLKMVTVDDLPQSESTVPDFDAYNFE